MDFKQPPRRSFGPAKPAIKPAAITDAIPNELPKKIGETTVATVTVPAATDDASTAKEDLRITPAAPRTSKKKKLIIVVAAILVVVAGAILYWFALKPPKNVLPTNSAPANVIQKKKVAPTPRPTSPLTGVELTNADLSNRPVTGVMIENSPEARPQSGLLEAGIVYEAIAEGGITRFLAVYQDTKPSYIGPVRSARPYYLDFIAPYDAGYAHVGGSPQALSDINALGIKDLDQFYNGNYYTRVTERYAPHNVYTGFDKLDALNKIKGYATSKFAGFVRKPDIPQTPTARIVDLSISAPLYSPRFEYDAISNTYKRSQGGEPHIDAKSKIQLAPKVVIALITDKSYDPDGYHTDYKTSGSGKMYVFQDGIVSEGTWQKTDRKSQYVFTDKNSLPMKLNAGQTWISLVTNQSDVTYKP